MITSFDETYVDQNRIKFSEVLYNKASSSGLANQFEKGDTIFSIDNGLVNNFLVPRAGLDGQCNLMNGASFLKDQPS